MNRRSWLRTAAGLLVAPAIVRAESIMRVRPPAPPPEAWIGADVPGVAPGTVLLLSAWVKPDRPGAEWALVKAKGVVRRDGFVRLPVPPASRVSNFCAALPGPLTFEAEA